MDDLKKVLANPWMRFLLSTLLAVAFFAWSSYEGAAGDCKPGQIDGQCGMSTAFGRLFGIVGGVVIFFCGVFWALSTAAKNNKSS